MTGATASPDRTLTVRLPLLAIVKARLRSICAHTSFDTGIRCFGSNVWDFPSVRVVPFEGLGEISTSWTAPSYVAAAKKEFAGMQVQEDHAR